MIPLLIAHFQVAFCLCVRTILHAKPYIKMCFTCSSFSCKLNSFLYENKCSLRLVFRQRVELNISNENKINTLWAIILFYLVIMKYIVLHVSSVFYTVHKKCSESRLQSMFQKNYQRCNWNIFINFILMICYYFGVSFSAIVNFTKFKASRDHIYQKAIAEVVSVTSHAMCFWSFRELPKRL